MISFNAIGKDGDPEALRAALQPLVDGAEDKALAELHAIGIQATAMLCQTITDSVDKLVAMAPRLLDGYHAKLVVPGLALPVTLDLSKAVAK